MTVKNLFVIPPTAPIAYPDRPKPPGPKSVKLLEAMPGYWRGRAFTRREMAKLFRKAGDMEAGNRHDREANKYEALAESNVALARRVEIASLPQAGL